MKTYQKEREFSGRIEEFCIEMEKQKRSTTVSQYVMEVRIEFRGPKNNIDKKIDIFIITQNLLYHTPSIIFNY